MQYMLTKPKETKSNLNLVKFLRLQKRLGSFVKLAKIHRQNCNWDMYGYMMYQAGEIAHQVKKMSDKDTNLKINPEILIG